MSSKCRSKCVFSNILLEKAVDFRCIDGSYPTKVLPLITLVRPNLVITMAHDMSVKKLREIVNSITELKIEDNRKGGVKLLGVMVWYSPLENRFNSTKNTV